LWPPCGHGPSGRPAIAGIEILKAATTFFVQQCDAPVERNTITRRASNPDAAH
jgi:hypothetical protein